MAVNLEIDELLYRLLAQQNLLKIAPILARDSVIRIDHLYYVKDDKLTSYGLSSRAIRRLRSAFFDKELRKKIESRMKNKEEIKYVDISNLKECNTSGSTPTRLIQRQMLPRNEEILSSSSQLVTIMKNDIKLMEEIGQGTFAIVKKAKWRKDDFEIVDVVVKTIREATEKMKQDLINEIKLISRLHHPKLIQLYGIVLGDPMLMVLEFCDGGSLLDRLRTEEKPTLLATQLMDYSQQIALGMSFLEQNNYVHRYLAARNVFITENQQQIKICNFKLSRILHEPERKELSFPWSSPESLKFHRFSSASDVWAFGVTLWEIWTNGEIPWTGYEFWEILQNIEGGERLKQPENVPNNVYDIMLSCWALKPKERPDFKTLHQLLLSIKFDAVEITIDFFPTVPTQVEVKQGQRFIVLEERNPTTVFGQNDTTRKYGLVSRTVLDNETKFDNNLFTLPTPPVHANGMNNFSTLPPAELSYCTTLDDISTLSTSHESMLIMKNNVQLMEKLGENTFTIVKKAKWRKTDSVIVDVVVKIIKHPADEETMINEIKIMSKLSHPNLVEVLGVVLGDPVLLVQEFCEGGTLLDRLRHKDKPPLLATQLMDYSQQIANGMTFLELEGHVHQHLSTTNVLLFKNEQQIKIYDFGLLKLLNKKEANKVQVRCCPPEVLRSKRFSTASDVWAFGVTLWEMWTNGEIPWADYGFLEILNITEQGEKLEKPENAPNSVYDIMLSCWALKPEERPDFETLYQQLLQIKFDIVFIKSDYFPTIPTQVEVKQGQRFIVLEERSPITVFGQNDTTRKYGLLSKTTYFYSARAYLNWRPPTPPLRNLSINSGNNSPLHAKDPDPIASAIDTDSAEAINKLCLLMLHDTPTSPTSHESMLIMKDNVQLMEDLGEGTFTIVKKAKWHKTDSVIVDVAVKIIKHPADEKTIINEIKMMSKLCHPHLIEIHGVVLGDPVLLVQEFCEGGALLDRLRHKDKPPLLATQLMDYSQQIANGMTFLELEGHVHQHLSTKNVLLFKNEQQIKICDFGLSKLLNKKEANKIQSQCCPPEVLRSKRFSTASDVWAFGVTLWEMWTNGEIPWANYGYEKILQTLEDDEKLRKPENAPNSVYDIMLSCWALEPENRPNFTTLYQLLSSIKFDTFSVKPKFTSVFPVNPLAAKTERVEMKPGQGFIVLEERSPTTVFGQNDTTRKYGLVPRTILVNEPNKSFSFSQKIDESTIPVPPPRK